MPDRAQVVSNALGMVGASAGAVFGYVLTAWVARQGFHALVLPGWMLGLGCGMLARHRSIPRGVVCGFAGLAAGIFAESAIFPFVADKGLSYFLGHYFDLPPVVILGHVAGALIAFWLGKDAGYGRPPLGDRKPNS